MDGRFGDAVKDHAVADPEDQESRVPAECRLHGWQQRRLE
jgi:hypothetical protein